VKRENDRRENGRRDTHAVDPFQRTHREPALMKPPLQPFKSSKRLASTLLAVALLSTFSAAPAVAAAPSVVPVIPAGLPTAIEPLSPYVEEASCEWLDKPGATAFGDLLRATYPGTSYGISRPCTGTMHSEHYDGRAVDWMNTIRKPATAAQATALLQWLFAADKAGNKYANVRRLGIMYIIWNGQIWGSYSPTAWRPYQDCAKHPEVSYDTTCHRDHIHFSLSWAGAMRRTSYWTKQVAATDYGPCRPADLNYAPAYSGINPTKCPSYPTITAPAGSSAGYMGLVKFSGAVLRAGNSGTPVAALQGGFSMTKDGSFGPKTTEAVKYFQSRHGRPVTGVVDAATWRALLLNYRPAVKTPPAPTAGVDVTPVAMGVVASGETETVYARGTDNRVWYRDLTRATNETDEAGWQVLDGVVSSGPDAATSPVIGSGGPTTHYLVARSATTSLLFRVRSATTTVTHTAGTTSPASTDGTWTDLGGGLTTAPAIARTTTGELLVVGRGRDGAAWIRTSTGPGTVWTAWTKVGGAFTSAIDAAPTSTGFVLTGRGGNGVLYQETVGKTGVPVGTWASTGHATTSAPATATSGDGDITVFSRVTGNTVMAWPSGRSYGGALTSAPAAFIRGGDSSATTVLVGQSADGAVWSSEDGGTWRSLGGAVK
jgi:peptidoglycan hydrolase-like protein with peptidoglycan-binding domain